MRPSSAPFRTVSPSSTVTRVIAPASSARTVASRAALSSPETLGPTTISPLSTVTMFSAPICTGAGGGGVLASSLSPALQAARRNAKCKMLNAKKRLVLTFRILHLELPSLITVLLRTARHPVPTRFLSECHRLPAAGVVEALVQRAQAAAEYRRRELSCRAAD